jgi:hypothetical protein
VRIEGNHFHTPGAALLIAGDANYWFESGAVRDVPIRGNTFENCNHGVWGRAAIEINPEIAEPHQAASRYHRNIRIEDNTFHAFDGRLIFAQCVDGLAVRGNRVVASRAYPPHCPEGPAMDIRNCDRVTIDAPGMGTPPGFQSTP